MLPEPLHPAIVHFPIAFVVLLPLVAVLSLWFIRRGASPRRAWAIPVVTAGALALSAWAAVLSGEGQEERVEAVVPEAPIERHEEAAETFLVLSGLMVLLAAGGLAPGRMGRITRVAATAGAVALVAAGVQVGRSGGDLVYRHGAASAYAPSGTPPAVGLTPRDRGSDERAPTRTREDDEG